MLILALDTTTRAGSLSLEHDGTVLETLVGDGGRTHATRLPGDILDCLARHGLTLADIELYAVAAGPGSFTGLRIGIATIQGLAFAHGRPVVGVSALDALAEAAAGTRNEAGATSIAAWMDAQRGEVYACRYRAIDSQVTAVDPAIVEKPEAVLDAWRTAFDGPVRFTGDGAIAYADVLSRDLGERVEVVRPVPALAPALARIARREAGAGRAVHPHAIRPIYIRRPDAELVRDRRAGLGR
jgi:tRNA threonylcarbamoyladenosine biosynthesis protein TsaB